MASAIIPYIESVLRNECEFPSPENYEHGTVIVKNPLEVRALNGRVETEASYCRCQVTDTGQIVVIGGTPEARALYVGLIRDDEVIPARLHVGVSRRRDTQVAMYHALQVLSQLPETKYLLEEPYGNIGVIGVLRASEGLGVMEALADHLDYNYFPYDMIKAKHIGADNLLGRDVEIHPPDLEGFHRGISRLIQVDDGIAGGPTQGGVLEVVRGLLPGIESVLFLNVFASLKGSVPLLNYCQDIGLPATIVCFGGLLDSHSDLYYSPLPREAHRWADSRDKILHEKIWGNNAYLVGVGGNWTADWYSPLEALRDLEEYLMVKDGILGKGGKLTLEEFLEKRKRGELLLDDLKGGLSIEEATGIYGNSLALTPHSSRRENINKVIG